MRQWTPEEQEQFNQACQQIAALTDTWTTHVAAALTQTFERMQPVMKNLYGALMGPLRTAYEAAGSPYGDSAVDERVLRWYGEYSADRTQRDRRHEEDLREWAVVDFRHHRETGRHLPPPPDPEEVI